MKDSINLNAHRPRHRKPGRGMVRSLRPSFFQLALLAVLTAGAEASCSEPIAAASAPTPSQPGDAAVEEAARAAQEGRAQALAAGDGLQAQAIPAAAGIEVSVQLGQGAGAAEIAGTGELLMAAPGIDDEASADDGRGTPYIVERSDSICGLDDPKILTNPTTVDYQALLDVTPEVREMKKKKIGKNSARGIQLLNDAESRVRDKCEEVRSASPKGYCSVWKKIARRDGKSLTNLTAEVKKAILKK